MEKPYPTDWNDDDSAFRGLTKNNVSRHYDVKLTLHGQQRFIGSAATRERAARLYDLALWKFAYHLTTYRAPNFPEDFSFITREKVDREAPKLSLLYFQLPKLPGDELLSEDELRERTFDRRDSGETIETPAKMARYYDLIKQLARFQLLMRAGAAKNELRRLNVDTTKMPTVKESLNSVRDFCIKADVALSVALEALTQHPPFYEKVASDVAS